MSYDPYQQTGLVHPEFPTYGYGYSAPQHGPTVARQRHGTFWLARLVILREVGPRLRIVHWRQLR